MSRILELGTKENSYVEAIDEPEFHANHVYDICSANNNKPLQTIKFQKGPVKENGLNGLFHEDLIIILIDRLTSLNDSEYRCKENSCAITKLEEAQMWLRKRTEDRRNRGVLGTSTT